MVYRCNTPECEWYTHELLPGHRYVDVSDRMRCSECRKAVKAEIGSDFVLSVLVGVGIGLFMGILVDGVGGAVIGGALGLLIVLTVRE